MSDSDNKDDQKVKLSLKIPTITAECESQTVGKLVSTSPEIQCDDMDTTDDKQGMSLRKRRNLSKNRGQAARQREKTPEPGRTLKPHEDTPTSDDDDFFKPQRNSREIEADNTYQEMKRLVQEQANVKDPVYDLDTDQLLEQRAMAAIERRRRSISPFAIPDKEELACLLERKGSFIDPTNKLLSTNYSLTPKDEDSSRRNSLTIEPPKDAKHTLATPSPSPKESNFPMPLPATPKKIDEIVYPDEKKPEEVAKKPKTPVKNESVFTFEDKDIKRTVKAITPKPETPASPAELVTKVIQIERTPSKKIIPEKKPNVEVRERIVRTPSRRMSTDIKPIIAKQPPTKPAAKEENQSRAPPIKPARSKSASRFGNKTSESEMSEDQQNAIIEVTKRRNVPAPRRYTKNKMSPKVNRSQSVHRYEDTRPVDKTGTGMSQTSREIIELMQKARARSLSMPKDDPRTPPEYKPAHKVLKTPNKTPNTLRQSRGVSCPKTIQIISEKEILSGLLKIQKTNLEKRSTQSSGYIDASQSEYTSSCYSSSPSENEYDFDLSVRTAELTHKLNVLSQENDRREMMTGIILAPEDNATSQIERGDQKSVLRKRSVIDSKAVAKKDNKERAPERKVKRKSIEERNKKVVRSRWKLIANWQQFKQEQSIHCEQIRNLRNKCIIDLLILVIMCGLGGMMFKTLEGSFENAYKCSTRNVKRDFIENLWRGSHNLREEDWKSMARKKLFEFEDQLHTAHEAGVTSYSGQRSWNFMNSFVYCLTLVTTVGYGHIAPKTTYGRVATIVYATIGIPLFLILLADFGKLFTRIIKFFWAYIRRFYYTRSCRKVRRTGPMQEVMKGLNIVYDVVRRPSQIFSEEDIEGIPEGVQPPPIERKSSDVPPPLPPKPGTLTRDLDVETDIETPAPSVFEIDDEFNLPISVAVFILLVYIIIGAFVYSLWEKWNFFESFYFIFISISTIGLGDLVPDHPMFMMASILYLVFGFALTSMFINVVQLKLSNTFKQASAKLGATIGLKVAEEDGSLVPITPPATEIVPVHKPRTEIDDSKSKESDNNDTKNR